MAQGSDGLLAAPLRTSPACVDSHNLDSEQASSIVSEFHEQFVPEFAAQALDHLYGSLYASFSHFCLSDTGQTAPHTWVGYRHGEIVGVLLFRLRFDQALVLTEMFCLGQAVTDAFSRAVFTRYREVKALHFNAISLSEPLVGWPLQYYAFSENYVIPLPQSVDQYLASIGKSTRKTLRGYGNRLQREFPNFSWEVRVVGEMRAHELRSVIRQLHRFKRDSMAARGKRAEISRRETARLLLLARHAGLLGIARIGDRVCGGSLACRIGDNYVMLLSAADPALASYRLGMLCCFWSVCDCIRTGGRECHLLWGRYHYKTQLLGEPRSLLRLVIYRSRLRMVLSPLRVTSMLIAGIRYRLRQWVLRYFAVQSSVLSRWFSRTNALRRPVKTLTDHGYQSR
ncbi:MAG: GNAT family N-acetyltransferase [Oxalobacteraceae bacterium]|nr:GNAT family N-acetyltransferase [Oxalobacteraceae bacterium]